MTKKAPDITEFRHLSEEMQLNTVQIDGVYIGKRTVNEEKVILFQLYGFYVEVWYRVYRNEIRQIISSDDPVIITPYLDQIRIRDLDKDL